MKKFIKILKWFFITIIAILVLGVLYLRFSRFSDKMIYQMNGAKYESFQSELNFQEYYFDIENNVKLHGILFKPDTIQPIGTIFNYSGKGMNLMASSLQGAIKPLLENGFQVFNFERRNFGKSTGEAISTETLRKDALFVFDELLKNESVKDLPIIIWGQSLGGTFGTMNAVERESKIKGLILESTFSSFPDVGKVYARILKVENFKWVVPLVMNNDFPVEKNIAKLKIPVVIIHSKSDKEIPYELGEKVYENSNKSNTEFWEIKSKHMMGIFDYEKEYVEKFKQMIKK
jgi:esterase/lipase